jgi:hypothetical protein
MVRGKLFLAETLMNATAQMPVGIIAPFAGEWTPYRDRDGSVRQREDELGWMLCEGRALEKAAYPELYRL